MTLTKQLFYSPMNQAFISVNSEVCNGCACSIEKVGKLFGDWHKSPVIFESGLNFYCKKCARRVRRVGVASSDILVLFLDESCLPEDAFPIVIKPPLLNVTRSCAEVALDFSDGARVFDNAKVSRDPNRNVMPGALKHKRLVLDRINLLDDKSLASMEIIVKNAINSVPLLPGTENKTKQITKSERGKKC